MKLCKVVGAVWGGKEAESLGGRKLMQVQPVAFVPGEGTFRVAADGADVPLSGSIIVALDQLGAGEGEYVLVAHWSRVRDLTLGPDVPTKDVVVAIVDAAEAERGQYPGGGMR